jgi:hypothetical protein
MRIELLVGVGQNAFFREFADELALILHRLGHSVTLSVGAPRADEGQSWVVLSPHEFVDVNRSGELLPESFARRAMAVTFEQPSTIWFERNLRSLPGFDACLDISDLGVAAFRRHGIDAERLVLGGTAMSPTVPFDDRDIDVAIFWSETERRTSLMHWLTPRLGHLRVWERRVSSQRPMYLDELSYVSGREMAQVLRRTRVVLNLHRTDTPYFEWPRCRQALEAGALYVNETSIGGDPLVSGRHFVELGAAPSPSDDAEAEALRVWSEHAAHTVSGLASVEQAWERVTASATDWLHHHSIESTVQAIVDALPTNGPPSTAVHGVVSAVARATPVAWVDRGARRPVVEMWGTTDIDAVGSALLPVVMAQALREAAADVEISGASPLGRAVAGFAEADVLQPPYRVARAVLDVERHGAYALRQGEPANAIVVAGGGTVVDAAASIALTPSEAVEPTVQRLMRCSLLLSGRCRIVWHAIGVPTDVDPEFVAWVARLGSSVDLMSTYDDESQRCLTRDGTRNPSRFGSLVGLAVGV